VNKTELIAKVAEKSDMTKKDAELVVNGVFEVIEEALASGDKVQLVGFGTFEKRSRAARIGRNPQTGEEIQIEESTVPAFKPGNTLKEKVK
jgi:DNA-binding protein HU-beta